MSRVDASEFIYLHIDLTKLSAAQKQSIRTRVRDKLRSDPRFAKCEIGISVKDDGTQAILKVNDAALEWRDALPQAFKDAIIAKVTKAQARALVTAPGWWPPEEP